MARHSKDIKHNSMRLKMKSKFSRTWKASVQPRKQRKYNYNAPLHVKNDLLSVNLSKELRKAYGTRNIRVRSGDKVKILRGNHKGKQGKVDTVDVKKIKVYVTGVETQKREGSKVKVPINPSNLQITELNLADKKRKQRISAKESKEEK